MKKLRQSRYPFVSLGGMTLSSLVGGHGSNFPISTWWGDCQIKKNRRAQVLVPYATTWVYNLQRLL